MQSSDAETQNENIDQEINAKNNKYEQSDINVIQDAIQDITRNIEKKKYLSVF